MHMWVIPNGEYDRLIEVIYDALTIADYAKVEVGDNEEIAITAGSDVPEEGMDRGGDIKLRVLFPWRSDGDINELVTTIKTTLKWKQALTVAKMEDEEGEPRSLIFSGRTIDVV